MKSAVSKNLDSLLRRRQLHGIARAVGWTLMILGIGLMLITVQYTPEQLATRFHVKPGSHEVFLLLPAPEQYFTIGIVTMILGLVVVVAEKALRKHPDMVDDIDFKSDNDNQL